MLVRGILQRLTRPHTIFVYLAMSRMRFNTRKASAETARLSVQSKVPREETRPNYKHSKHIPGKVSSVRQGPADPKEAAFPQAPIYAATSNAASPQ